MSGLIKSSQLKDGAYIPTAQEKLNLSNVPEDTNAELEEITSLSEPGKILCTEYVGVLEDAATKEYSFPGITEPVTDGHVMYQNGVKTSNFSWDTNGHAIFTESTLDTANDNIVLTVDTVTATVGFIPETVGGGDASSV